MLIKCYSYSSFDVALPTSKKNTWNLRINKLSTGFLFFFNLLVLTYVVFNECLVLARTTSSWLSKKRPYITLKKTQTSRLFKTIQKGPMAHRQWSQEQVGFKVFRFVFTARLAVTKRITDPKSELLLIGLINYALYNSAFLNFFASITTQQTYLKLL